MVKTDIYDYINVLDKAADASALRNKAIANNMANIDTPGYKRQDVSFAANLEEALRHSRFKSLDDKVGSIRMDRLRGKQFTDAEGYSYRLDGNNVDIDTENAELAKNNILYNGLTQSLTAEFQNIRAVTQK
ncbi:MAG: flagellar basal body rod protein FlgB [Lachnospiraceae bacterium]|nr:flagellar basal body rod protein FlgB [Lachnospiraceae bacterium]